MARRAPRAGLEAQGTPDVRQRACRRGPGAGGVLIAASTSPRGRRVLLTGATGGIGRAIVDALTACECRIGVCDVSADVESAFADNGAVDASACFDVRDSAAAEASVRLLISGLGGCDAIVANAGVVDTIHRAERFPEEEWRKDLETNLSGQFHVVQAAFPALAESGDGRIVLISSASAVTGLPGQVAYTAAKAGIVGMARTLATEWASRGVRCNVVMPGMIATPKVKGLPDATRESLTRSIPLGRIGETAELAGTVAFLLSPAAAYITGAVIRVDGGLGLTMGGLMSGR
jgi:NAD(P)-dependent dehydrogenase (short-subunit alcohol dehydrogenase family)